MARPNGVAFMPWPLACALLVTRMAIPWLIKDRVVSLGIDGCERIRFAIGMTMIAGVFVIAETIILLGDLAALHASVVSSAAMEIEG